MSVLNLCGAMLKQNYICNNCFAVRQNMCALFLQYGLIIKNSTIYPWLILIIRLYSSYSLYSPIDLPIEWHWMNSTNKVFL